MWICPVLCPPLRDVWSYQERVKTANNMPVGLSRAPEAGNSICYHLLTTWPSGACWLSPSMGPVAVRYTLAEKP